jgi:hypothetical protein
MLSLACRAVAVAMATAVIAFGAMHIVSPQVSIFLLGIGLLALAIMPLTVE